MNWKISGYDTFEGEDYSLPGTYDTEALAVAAGQKHLQELEKTQPSSSSGGQDGIQDHVFVVRPDGTKYRLRPDDTKL